MWPFKKKTEQIPIDTKVVKTILCIPGIWKSFEEIRGSIFTNTNGEYFEIAGILTNIKTGKTFTIEIFNRDERMLHSFMTAGKVTRMSDHSFEQINKHNYVVYISGLTGSMEETEHIAKAGYAMLKAGGVGIKIESTGKAFDKDTWSDSILTFDPSMLYNLFVVDSIVDGKGSVYSCGMHNLGLPDTIIWGGEFQESVDLIRIFSFYQIFDKPSLQTNQTFSATIDSPIYRITNELRQPNLGQELFENPFGMWRLTKIQN